MSTCYNRFADRAGKKGGEFYTPASVVELMVRLIKPQAGNSIYDPTVGSGGMLIQSHRYVEEHGGDASNLDIYGQDSKPAPWAICKMNMIIHDIQDAKIHREDTLAHPHWSERGRTKQFDRVIANPPFSENYNKTGMEFTDRFEYGFTPVTGKKADLMFLQHMVASTKSDGIMVTVMPHGVLFRGGKERDIRKGVLENKQDILQAIIGLPLNLFYGTSIPACLIVINKNKPKNRKGLVQIINADAEYGEGRNQNFLRPEDIEKICYVFDNFLAVPGYSAIVPFADITGEENDCNLNIRRYVDNTPPAEPHDVKAHLFGGIPQAEIDTLNGWLTKYGIAETDLFISRGDGYADFSVADKTAIKAAVHAHDGVTTENDRVREAAAKWWTPAEKAIVKGVRIFEYKTKFTDNLLGAFELCGILDMYQSIGVFANWWQHEYLIREYDEEDIDADGKETTTAVKETISVKNVFKTVNAEGFIPALVSDEIIARRHFHDELAELGRLEQTAESAAAELQNFAESVEMPSDDDENAEPREVKVTDVEKHLKKQKSAAGKKQYAKLLELKKVKSDASKALNKAHRELEDKVDAIRDKLTQKECRALVVELLRDSFDAELEKYLAAELDKTVKAVAHLWDKYAVSAAALTANRTTAENRLNAFLRGLGYVEN